MTSKVRKYFPEISIFDTNVKTTNLKIIFSDPQKFLSKNLNTGHHTSTAGTAVDVWTCGRYTLSKSRKPRMAALPVIQYLGGGGRRIRGQGHPLLDN